MLTVTMLECLCLVDKMIKLFYNVLVETFPFLVLILYTRLTYGSDSESGSQMICLISVLLEGSRRQRQFLSRHDSSTSGKGSFFSDVVGNALVICRLLCHLFALVLLVSTVLQDEQIRSGCLLSVVRKAGSPCVSVQHSDI